jgi:hypothetical protein
VCTHIKGCLQSKDGGSPSHVQSVVQKIGEDIRKVEKISRIVNRTFALELNMIKFKHDGPQMSRQKTC